jgi:hypothetical protein
MKLFVCQGCDAVFRSDPDVQSHSASSAHGSYKEYELEDFLTRFLVQA